MLQPLKRKSLAESVYEQLRDHILHGDLEPGDELPAERILSEQLNVNRSAVREGLKRLEQAGLVSIQQGESTKILDFTKSAGLNMLATLIIRPDGTINTTVVRSVLEMRTSMAIDVARCCAARSPEKTNRALRENIQQMASSPSDLRELQRLAMQFWGLLVGGTNNIAYQLAYNSLDATYRSIEAQLRFTLAAELQCLEHYERLQQCVETQDSDGAAKAAKAIVVLGQQAIAAVLDAVDREQEPNS
jgi:GntR family transcriptional regulator, transcriptional repressor for pyruvate dehydrogenase complex